MKRGSCWSQGPNQILNISDCWKAISRSVILVPLGPLYPNGLEIYEAVVLGVRNDVIMWLECFKQSEIWEEEKALTEI